MPGEFLLLQNARDYSRYIYFTDRFHCIYTLDTEKMEFMPTLKFGGGLQIINIASVFDGMMMIEGVRNNDVAGFTTILPEGYYTISDDSLPRWLEVTKQAFVDGVKSVLFNPP
ncbi:hypothetical protein PENTCL1PPCAC_8663 [Pristionchus entomophagus]|uniref:Uncharacterized protein n=1 Tax=Pristionchus entomophagus TaxID=358040 RepID=A0AAV5T0X1_9BILA|nr:hypothetical protein PENTCL1PPCAC_8663 [Pristionchus entomophagus]